MLHAPSIPAARPSNRREVDRMQFDPYSGLPRNIICSHLICPSVLFLTTTTLIGSLYLTPYKLPHKHGDIRHRR